MTTDDYRKRMQALGIERGWLEDDKTCPPDPQSVTSVYRTMDPMYYSKDRRQYQPAPGPDLSHMNPPRHAQRRSRS